MQKEETDFCSLFYGNRKLSTSSSSKREKNTIRLRAISNKVYIYFIATIPLLKLVWAKEEDNSLSEEKHSCVEYCSNEMGMAATHAHCDRSADPPEHHCHQSSFTLSATTTSNTHKTANTHHHNLLSQPISMWLIHYTVHYIFSSLSSVTISIFGNKTAAGAWSCALWAVIKILKSSGPQSHTFWKSGRKGFAPSLIRQVSWNKV